MEIFDEVFGQVERPFAWLDYEALDANIAFVKQACGEKKIRIATKSIRSVAVLQYIAKKMPLAGYMTFTAAETAYLLEQGFDHLLIGYPVMESQSIRRILQLKKDVTFMVDHITQAKLLDDIAKELQVTVRICIDINVSTNYKVLYFGSKRSPLTTIRNLDTFLQQLLSLTHVLIVGVMGYDAQLAGVAELTDTPFDIKGAVIRRLKSHSSKKVQSFRQLAVAHIRHYVALEFVNAGGSGSMHFSSEQQEVTEITVGSAFFSPALFDNYEKLSLTPAAGFAVRITRQFAPHIAVAHGGGYIASGATGRNRSPIFHAQPNFKLLSLEGAGEVQTPIQMPVDALQIGDTVYMRHAKAGELCERFNELHIVRDNEYLGPIKTYRGDGQCFL